MGSTTIAEAKKIKLEDGQHPHLAQFTKELAQTTALSFTPKSHNSSWAFYEGDTYCCGWVGFGDFRVGGKGTKNYTVQSRLIRNMKYNDSNSQYHMAMTTKHNIGLKNAKRYLSPLNVAEMAAESAQMAGRSFRDVSNEANHEMRRLGNRLFQHNSGSSRYSSIETELKNLITLGHEFVDKELQAGLVDFFAQKDETKVLNNRTDSGVFVYTTVRMNEPQCAVLPVEELSNWNPKIHDMSETKWYVPSELPEDIMGKFSMLQLVEDNHYVDGVGYRVSDRMCFLLT